MFPPRCSHPPCRNIDVSRVAAGVAAPSSGGSVAAPNQTAG